MSENNSDAQKELEELMHDAGKQMMRKGLMVEDLVPHLKEDMINIGVLIYEQDWRKEKIVNFDDSIESLKAMFERELPGFTESALEHTNLTPEEYGFMLLGFFTIGQTHAMINVFYSDIEKKIIESEFGNR